MATPQNSVSPAANTIYQLKVTLAGSKPPIWRRVQTPGSTTLAGLHRIIQKVMGWENQHLHQFSIGGVIYGPPEPDLDDAAFEMKDERRARLFQVAPTVGGKFTYEYDFGDGWEHSVVVERIMEPQPGVHYPHCVAGRRACPPEDSGGVWGYDDLIETLKNPSNPEYEEMREWVGDNFNPEAFSLDAVNAGLEDLR